MSDARQIAEGEVLIIADARALTEERHKAFREAFTIARESLYAYQVRDRLRARCPEAFQQEERTNA